MADVVLVCLENGGATSVAGSSEVFGRLVPGIGGTAGPAAT